MCVYGTQSFFTAACESWVLVTPRKAITKVQEAAGQKPSRKRWEKVEILKSSSEWNMSWRRFGCQTGRKLTRTGTTKVRVFRELPETTLQRVERVEKNKARKIETEGLRQVKNEQSDSRCWVTQSKNYWHSWHKSTTSRATRGVDQN